MQRADSGHPHPGDDRCSAVWDRDDLPAWGTAARASFWVALEQPGPWGRDAATGSHLDPVVGARLGTWCAERGGRLVLIRRPGRHADLHVSHRRRQVFVASSLATRPWLGTARVETSDLPDLLEALGESVTRLTDATSPGWLAPHPGLLLVCTNAKRDQCCALLGRPIAAALSPQHGGRVWECSHLGGHRFAPTALALPTGQVFARVGARLAGQVLDDLAHGRLTLPGARHDRGRSHLPPADQVVEIAARDRWDEPRPEAVTVSDGVASHQDGRRYVAHPSLVSQAGLELPESCGKSVVPVAVWGLEVASATAVEGAQ